MYKYFNFILQLNSELKKKKKKSNPIPILFIIKIISNIFYGLC